MIHDIHEILMVPQPDLRLMTETVCEMRFESFATFFFVYYRHLFTHVGICSQGDAMYHSLIFTQAHNSKFFVLNSLLNSPSFLFLV